MNLKLIMALILVFLSIDNATITIAQSSQSINSSKYAILKFNPGLDQYIFKGKFKSTSLSDNEIKNIEKLIAIRISEYNKMKLAENKKLLEKYPSKPHEIISGNLINNPADYYKQFIAVTDAKGQKIVWANCFCTPEEKSYWKKGIVEVEDGGSCFFNLKINLTTNTVYDFMVNGEA
ncbi:hypothetical protein [uncultured Mucilaginibacter sp.]|uniref:hypothetical protein n=1 Tax=uncultured Mucilaginibacter sp. TaxID=797541 RepID=UPI0025F6CE26|nr:hypothetical protein [uncultured Mucilaginibacter sp.]